MSELKGKYFKVLDKGFISLVDCMGDDQAIEQAARVSYGKGTRKVSDTRNLIRYLIRNSHSSPVEQASLKFHIKCPLFVTQQILRHRTAKINQESGRYSVIKDEFYTPTKEQYTLQAKDNKQGRSEEQILEADYQSITERINENRHRVYSCYEEQISLGISREVARIDLPVATYTQLYWKMDLRNLLHFMSLRCDKHAQYEIRVYADIMAGIVKELFPLTFEAWYDYTFKAVSFSRLEMSCLAELLSDENAYRYVLQRPDAVTHLGERFDLSKRECEEFIDKLLNRSRQDFNLDKLETIDVLPT